MPAILPNSQEFAQPTENDIRLAEECRHRLAKAKKPPRICLEVDGTPEEPISLPLPAFQMLESILAMMAQGHAVTLLSRHAELTTQQAADILHVSRPFLVALLEKGEIPFRKVGKHRRIRSEDLMEYREKRRDQRHLVLDELVAYDQELGLGD